MSAPAPQAPSIDALIEPIAWEVSAVLRESIAVGRALTKRYLASVNLAIELYRNYDPRYLGGQVVVEAFRAEAHDTFGNIPLGGDIKPGCMTVVSDLELDAA